jgi:hypothetical protein
MAYLMLRRPRSDDPEKEVVVVEKEVIVEVEPENRVTEEYARIRHQRTIQGAVLALLGFVLVLVSVFQWTDPNITVLLIGVGVTGGGFYMIDPGSVKGYADTVKGFIPGKK